MSTLLSIFVCVIHTYTAQNAAKMYTVHTYKPVHQYSFVVCRKKLIQVHLVKYKKKLCLKEKHTQMLRLLYKKIKTQIHL